MKKNKSYLLIVLLIIIFLLDQCIIGFHLDNSWRYATKPLLIPILIIYYLLNLIKPNKLFISGLVMSLFGDVFLMFSGGFVPGLGSFLIAHILYIFAFKPLFHKKNLIILPFILTFIIGLISFLFPHLGAMKIPVILYAITIGSMLYIAFGTAQKWLIIGALLFVISDSILAINIFYEHSTLSGMMVMLTYVIAQFCLTQGMLNTKK